MKTRYRINEELLEIKGFHRKGNTYLIDANKHTVLVHISNDDVWATGVIIDNEYMHINYFMYIDEITALVNILNISHYE